MKRINVIITLLALSLTAWADDDKLTTFNPVEHAVISETIAPDARGAGMGDIGAATDPDVNSQYWNPAKTETTFIVTHDRTGSQVVIEIDVFDTSGRQLWTHKETGVSSSQASTVTWDLTTTGGHRLSTGVYLYRVRLSSEGSSQASKAKKLIILGNK
jgi:hypothetical protein